MCKYLLLKHSLCGCTTVELYEECRTAKRNCSQCLYRPPPFLPFDPTYNFRMYTGPLDKPSLTPGDRSSECIMTFETRKSRRKTNQEERSIMVYAGLERRMALDRCAFCEEDWVESSGDLRMAGGEIRFGD